MSQGISLLLKKEGRPLAPALRTQGERVVAAIFQGEGPERWIAFSGLGIGLGGG